MSLLDLERAWLLQVLGFEQDTQLSNVELLTLIYQNWGNLPGQGGGVTDHGELAGLNDDDHPQYHNDARGDARYSPLGHTHGGGGGGAVDSVNGQTGEVVLDQDDVGDGTTFKQYSQTEKTKLAGIATGATANSSDSVLLDRANHTGTQAISTVSGLQTALDGKASTSHTHAFDDLTGSLSIADLPAGSMIVVDKVKNGNSWPGARPTARTDITVLWIGDTDPGSLAINGDKWDDI